MRGGKTTKYEDHGELPILRSTAFMCTFVTVLRALVASWSHLEI